MKVKAALKRVEDAVNTGDYMQANELLNKYRRNFGNRKFTYWLRTLIRNGLWEVDQAIPTSECAAAGPYKTARIAAISKIKQHFWIKE